MKGVIERLTDQVDLQRGNQPVAMHIDDAKAILSALTWAQAYVEADTKVAIANSVSDRWTTEIGRAYQELEDAKVGLLKAFSVPLRGERVDWLGAKT